MKRIYPIVLAGLMLLLAGCHKNLWNDINDLKSRVQALEEKCNTMNTNITALQVLINAQSSGDMISNVSEVTYGNSTIGYTITFTSGKTITLYNGKDGANGQDGANGTDGYTPSIGVAQDTDGIYYWVVDGKWLTDAEGNKIPVTNGKGEKGDTGESGQDGTDGADGKTPQLKIEDGYWYLSYDGTNWTKLGKATGENGKDGTNGTDGINGADGEKGEKGDQGEKGDAGDNIFSSVTQDDNYVYFTLADSTIIKIAKNSSGSDSSHADSDIIEFKDLNVKSALLLHTPVIDTNGDGEISYGEARAATRIRIANNHKITSFKELEHFTNITSVYFKNCENLFELILPEGLDSLSNQAFYGTESSSYGVTDYDYRNRVLTTINIPASCRYIGSEAFLNCGNLKHITFAENSELLYIGTEAFQGCYALEELILPNSEVELRWILGANPRHSEYTNFRKLSIPESFLGKVQTFVDADTIIWNPTNFPHVYSGTFPNYSNSFCGLCGGTKSPGSSSNSVDPPDNTRSVIIADNVTKIPAYLCKSLTGIKEIVISDNVTSIGEEAFYGCSGATKITIGKNVAEIGKYAFSSCTAPMYITATTPPNIKYSLGSVTAIYVPKESVSAYRTAWSDYATKIIGYDFE